MIIYCVTDRRRFGLSVPALVERIGWLAGAGVDYVQLRERDLADRPMLDLARASVAAAAGARTRVLMSDRLDIAVASGAAGVHLREDSYPAARVRACAPPPFVIDRSVHDLAAARAVDAEGACDFLIFGTVFPSTGKPAGHIAAGLQPLEAICRASRLPVVAIGGIEDATVAQAGTAGAAGVAAVGALLGVTSAAQARDRVTSWRRLFDTGSRLV